LKRLSKDTPERRMIEAAQRDLACFAQPLLPQFLAKIN
jgi:hypothetical protein